MAPKPPSSDDQNRRRRADESAARRASSRCRRRRRGRRPAQDRRCRRRPTTGATTLDELDDDDDDEDLVVFTAQRGRRRAGDDLRFRPAVSGNYRKMLAFVGIGVLVETLFNVIMPLSLKFLIDDALGEEDFQALYMILGVLAVAGIITSIVAVWYERWDARLAAGLISDVRGAAVRARAGLAVVVFRADQARRNPVALLDRPVGLRRLGQDLRQQRGAAVPGIDRRHHPDVVPELAARRGGAAGVSDHADRPADPDAEGGAGELRAEAERIARCSAWCRKTSRRRRWSRRSACSAAPSAGSPCATTTRAQDRRRDVPLDHGGAHRDDLGAVAAPRGAGDRRLSGDQGPDHHRHLRHLRERVLGGVLQHRPSDAFHSGVDLVGGGGAAHPGTAGRADPRRRSRRRAGSAAHHQRHHLRSRHLPVRRQRRRRCSTISASSSMSARASPSSARQRLGQEHAAQSDPAALRARRGRG